MTLKVGEIIEGKVKTIVPFGVFVELENGETALCHISEISNEFVKDIKTVVKKNETLSFKVIESKDKKIALSRKGLEDKEEAPKKSAEEIRIDSFEEKMNKYIKEANEKLQSINQRTSRRRNSSRKNR